MAETKPSGEQIRFISDKTGDHILADYLEACERDGIPLFDLVEQIFDVDGNINPDFVQLRVQEVSANNYQIQMRLGPNVDPEANWVSISDDIFNDILAIATNSSDSAAADAIQTAADRIQTAADRVQTGLDATAAAVARSAAEAAANGMKWRPTVKAATTANITLSAPQTIDGVSIIAGDRVLVKDQSTASQNGVYLCAAGAWTRATDADNWDELVGQVVITEGGSTQADTPFICTIDAGGTLGTNNITWTTLPAAIADGSVTGAKLGSMTSAQLRTALSDETGTGVAVFNDGCSLTNPLISAGGGAFILPQSTNPLPTTDGDIRWDSDDNCLVVGDGSGQQIFYPGVQPQGRNKIINGAMSVSQRGSTFTGVANSAYTLDRWVHGKVGAVVGDITQNADVPSNNEFLYSLRHTVTTADASIAAGDFMFIAQRIEGHNVRDLIGNTFVISFWVRSSVTGTYCVALQNSGANRSYISEYTISAANTWEYKTITISGGLITAGTWDWTNGIGLDMRFTVASGSTFQTTANAWQTGQFLATSAQANGIGTIGNIFAITGVQLERGTAASTFEHRQGQVEVALCKRYFEWMDVIYWSGTTGVLCNWSVTKRTTPTLTNTPGSGSGGVFAAINDTSAYQSVVNSTFVTGYILANAEL